MMKLGTWRFILVCSKDRSFLGIPSVGVTPGCLLKWNFLWIYGLQQINSNFATFWYMFWLKWRVIILFMTTTYETVKILRAERIFMWKKVCVISKLIVWSQKNHWILQEKNLNMTQTLRTLCNMIKPLHKTLFLDSFGFVVT